MERSDAPSLVLVEDGSRDSGSLELVAQLLGWQTRRALGPRHALAELSDARADLLICELLLPGMHGLELARDAKQLYDVPTVIVTAARPSFAADAPGPSTLLRLIEKRGRWFASLFEILASRQSKSLPPPSIDAAQAIVEAASVEGALAELSTPIWEEWIRIGAIRALGERGARKARPFLSQRLEQELASTEPSSSLIAEVMKALRRCGGLSIDGSIQVLRDRRLSLSTRSQALRDLETASRDRARLESERLLEEGPLWLQIDAIESAARLDEVGLLARAARDPRLPQTARDRAIFGLLPHLDDRLAQDLDPHAEGWALPGRARGEGLSDRIEEGRRTEDAGTILECLREVATRYPRRLTCEIFKDLRARDPEPVRSAATQVAFELGAWSGDSLADELRDEPASIQGAALLGLMRRPDLDGLLELVDSDLDPSIRRVALFVLGTKLDPDRRSEMLRSGAHRAEESLRDASLVQLARLGTDGLDLLEALAVDDTLDPSTRASAILLLGLRADDEPAHRAVHAALASEDELVRAAGFELGFSRFSAREPELLARLEGDDRPIPCGFAALAGARDLAEAGHGSMLAIAESPRLDPSVRRSAEAALRGEPAASHDDAATTVLRGARALVEDIEDEFVPTIPEAPAAFIPDLLELEAPASANAPAAPSRSGREAESPRELRRALDRAIEEGPQGLRGLAALAAHPGAPIEVRTRAIKHLSTSFDSARAMPILLQLLNDPSSTVQNEALGGAMYLGDMPVDVLRSFVLSKSAAKIRARATRHLGVRLSREAAAPILEDLLEDQSTMVRRAALSALFPSLRSFDGASLEEGLVNLLEHHESMSVKISAAKALAVFGSARSLEALEAAARSSSQDARLGVALSRAIDEIGARYPARP